MSAADPAMVALPAGSTTLADRRTQRRWQVEVAPFRIGTLPVTQRVYGRLAPSPEGLARGERTPVVAVSWWDAVRFCNALSRDHGFAAAYLIGPDEEVRAVPGANGYRLPTEAEWEYACRAGTVGPRYGPLDEIAWYRANSGERLPQVGGKKPNPWGLHDMIGTVWEWCWDRYDPEVYGDYRVLRGGGWFDEHWSCRASVRRRSHPTLSLDDLGFRLARSAVSD